MEILKSAMEVVTPILMTLGIFILSSMKSDIREIRNNLWIHVTKNHHGSNTGKGG